MTESSPASSAAESCPPRIARYFMTIFVVSVLPAPDSPLTCRPHFFIVKTRGKNKKKQREAGKKGEEIVEGYGEGKEGEMTLEYLLPS